MIEAADADEAIAILVARLDIRILFTDIDMPGNMDGLRLAAAVRNRWPPVKILVTSGHHQVKAEQLPSEALFFRKPYNPEALVSALKHMAAA